MKFLEHKGHWVKCVFQSVGPSGSLHALMVIAKEVTALTENVEEILNDYSLNI